jgi:hypothetical protein
VREASRLRGGIANQKCRNGPTMWLEGGTT